MATPGSSALGSSRLGLLLVLLVCLAWSNSLRGPFVLDDHESVVGNASIRELNPWRWLTPPATAGETVSGRPVLNLSFALNYACGGLDPFGYHVANLAIHAAATLLLFGIVRLTLLRFGAGEGKSVRALFAAGVAACWALHPLQTAAVTYVSQRAESLAGLFLLLTLYGFIRAVSTDGPRKRLWRVLAVVACALGMATKETMAPAPLLVLLYDRTFIAGTFAGAWKERRRFHATLAASWLVLAALVWANHGRGGSAGFGTVIDPWTYLLTQAVAIPHYLLLVLRPVGLVFDYGAATAHSWGSALPGLIALAVAGAATLWALWRNRTEGFLGACFFLLLAPSSSIVPVATQTMAEHRMYLPLATAVLLPGVLLARCAGVRRNLGLACAVTAVVAMGLGVLTWQRNRTYRSELALWGDTVAKRPENPRARNNLGLALMAAGRNAEAGEQFLRCLELQPTHAFAHSNLGSLLLSQGRYEQARTHLEAACVADPRLVDARVNLGQALTGLGRENEAMAEYREALALDPAANDAAANLGALLVTQNRLDEAEVLLLRAFAQAPSMPEVHYHLGRLRERRGDLGAAETCYREAVRLRPRDAAFHLALGNCLAGRGSASEAEACVRNSLRLDDRSALAHFALGGLLAKQQRYEPAAEEFLAALRLDPAHVQARTNLGNCQLVTGRLREAISTYEEVLRLRPGEPTALRNLALAREYLGE
jgi:protein O-mannosyl-transferase